MAGMKIMILLTRKRDKGQKCLIVCTRLSTV